eukprot:TRINITY_DN33506_c0_g1_i1.p1 TRINITY_DN33506_c0_g1~~TRINITY_DN33506_c0_g1_i1.p1  ORF type:complete len:356 (+),score=48.57 TRINITY_DN33506_c0_g1_i1:65-1069(+)
MSHTITIQNVDGTMVVLTCQNIDSTVEELKQQYASQEGVDADLFDFHFEGHPLQENNRLHDIIVEPGCEFEITPSRKCLALRQLGETPATVEELIREVALSGPRVQAFLDAGIPPGDPDDLSFTAMHSAKDEGIITLLLEYGADIDAVTDKGVTPLLHSLTQMYYNVSKMLIRLGADVNKGDINGLTPLHLSYDLPVAEMLLAAGADVNAANSLLETPLNYRISWPGSEQFQAIKLFISNGASVNHVNSHGHTLIHLAVKYNPSLPLVSHLLNNHADPCVQNRAGDTALHIYLYRENPSKSVVSALLDKGNSSSINFINDRGSTPLHQFLDALR